MTQGHETVSTLAYDLVLQRGDGVGLAATSHDRSIASGGVEQSARIDLVPERLTLDEAISGSKFVISGSPNGPLSAGELSSVRWMGASVELNLSDWQQPFPSTRLAAGRLQSIQVLEGRVKGEVDLAPLGLRSVPCQQVSPECRAQLGDRRCGVDMRARQVRRTVTVVDGASLECDAPVDDRFRLGRARWISGTNCGLVQTIIALDAGTIVLSTRPPTPVQPGDRLTLWEGCDGRRATCKDRFDNILNFRGEADLPGTDRLIRYPGD